MGIEQYVDIYYIGKDKIKVGHFYVERIGKIIRTNRLNIVFSSHKEAKSVFETIKQAVKNLTLDSSVVLFQNEYVLISLPLSAIWEYNWVYTTDSALLFSTEEEAGQFFQQLKEKIASLKVRDVIGVIGGKATSQATATETGSISVKKVKFNILQDNIVKYIPAINPNQIQVFKIIQGQEELVDYDIGVLNPALSKYAIVLPNGAVSERNTDVLETTPIEGKQNLYEANLDITKYEDITQIYVAI